MARAWRSFDDRFERARKPVAVHELVERVVDVHRIAGDLREARLFADWSELVGDRIAERTRPDTIVGGGGGGAFGGAGRTLIVEVATSTWLHELRLLRPKIVADLLDKLGLPRFFDDIRFVLARDKPRQAPARKPLRRRTPRRTIEPVPATGEAREQIVRDASRVEDPELRELIARVRIAHGR